MAQILIRKISLDPAVTNPTLGEKYFSDWIGFGHCFLQNLPPADYEIFVQYAWPINNTTNPNNIVKDYTIRVYAEEQVLIKDNLGNISMPF